MARTVRVGEFQRMQRGPSHVGLTESAALGDAEQRGRNVVERDPLTGQIGDAPSPGFRNPPLTIPEQLAALTLQDDIAGMPLGQVVGLVRLAVAAAHVNATESEIRDEAERRHAAMAELIAAEEPIVSEEDMASEALAAQILAERHARGGHARYVIGGCPSCEPAADEAPVEPKPEDRLDAKLGAVSRSMTAAVESGTVAEVLAADDEAESDSLVSDGETGSLSETQPTMAERLQRLGVELLATAEWSLSMIVSKVREKSSGVEPAPTEDEIAAEANRIWRSFDVNRTGPREATVNGDGTVRDWRFPAPTPDRGPDVGTTHHTITDDEQRFSGAGAEDDDEEDLYPVPSILSFGDREIKEAADIRQIMYDLITETEDFPHLRGHDLDAVWVKQGGSTSQEATLYIVRPPGKYERRSTSAVMMLAMSADHLRSMRADRDTVEALVHEGLCSIARSKKGKLYVARPDFQGFAKNVGRFGAMLPKAKAAAVALAREIQDVRNQRLPFDDGAGVLIHDDGTPLSADEIAEMERRELADEPADPDQPYEDEDVDPLTDIDL